MSKTTLAFYRKSQHLSDMETERPRSMDTVRAAIREATEHVHRQVRQMESAFYGGRSCEEDIKELLPVMRSVMNTVQVSYVHAAWQTDEMARTYLDPAQKFRVEHDYLEQIRDYHRKILEFIPGEFSDVIRDVEHIVDYLNRYCLSFSPDEKEDQFLETLDHYERKRKDFTNVIYRHLGNIQTMADGYRGHGLKAKSFGLHTNEVARRCDCGDLLHLLVFPEAVQNVLNSCKGIDKWLIEDEQYTHFLRCDIEELEIKLHAQTDKLKALKKKFSSLEHRLKELVRDIKDLEDEVRRCGPREKKVKEEVAKLEEQLKMMHIDIELREEERKELNADDDDDDDYAQRDAAASLKVSARLSKIAEEISELRYKIPATARLKEKTHNKITRVLQYREALKDKRPEKRKLQHQVEYHKTLIVLDEIELRRMKRCLAILKEVYHKKTGPNLTKKIFHQLPLHVKCVRGRRGQKKNSSCSPHQPPRKDPLDKATKVVSKHINGDWVHLYRKLPFYPPRGERIKDYDVDAIIRDRYRNGDTLMAKDSLERWRRMNTRANLVELKSTLGLMNRADIVEQLDSKLAQRDEARALARKRWQKLRNAKLAIILLMSNRRGFDDRGAKKMATVRKADPRAGDESKLRLPRIVIR